MKVFFSAVQGWAVETTPGFNQLKPHRSVCQKVVNTNLGGQLKILSGRFSGGLRYLVRFYVSFIEKNKKNTVLSLPRALLTVRFQSQDLSTDFCIMPLQSRHLTLVFFHNQGQNRITIQGLLHRFKTITVINL